jgi:hypothetical protein
MPGFFPAATPSGLTVALVIPQNNTCNSSRIRFSRGSTSTSTTAACCPLNRRTVSNAICLAVALVQARVVLLERAVLLLDQQRVARAVHDDEVDLAVNGRAPVLPPPVHTLSLFQTV